MSLPATKPDVSLILAVRNDEDIVGRQIRNAARHLGALGRSFEIVAVNDGSRDNSLALLRLVARELPELRIVSRDSSGRALARGVAEASSLLSILVPDVSAGDPISGLAWSPLGWALSRVEAGRAAVVLRGRYVVARSIDCMTAIEQSGSHPDVFERRFERATAHLPVEIQGARRPGAGLLQPIRRLVASFGP